MKNIRQIENAAIAREWVVSGILLIAMLALGGYALVQGGKAVVAGISYAEARRATAECEQWADEAKVYPGYFLVRWQKMQCDTYGVQIDAPVQNYSSK
jgi:hypothetical protein